MLSFVEIHAYCSKHSQKAERMLFPVGLLEFFQGLVKEADFVYCKNTQKTKSKK